MLANLTYFVWKRLCTAAARSPKFERCFFLRQISVKACVMASTAPCTCKLRASLRPFLLDEATLKTVYERFGNQIRRGLSVDGHDGADTKCYMTYVQDLPTGEERGTYMALDLGGSNFRVLLVELKGNREADMTAKIFALPQHVITGRGAELFDHIAECLEQFVAENKIDVESLPLGFTFSFPCQQEGLTHAVLRRWTKGFTASGVENHDVCENLKEAIARRGSLNIHVIAIVNDTTGTLMSCAHQNPDCRVGVIIGTGTNACYVERSENCELLEDEYKEKPFMIVNTEWGAFGDGGDLEAIRTDADREVDAKSPHSGKQLFEKMTSGMFLGPLAQAILLQAVQNNLIFADACTLSTNVANVLTNKANCIETHHISEVEGDQAPDYPETRRILKELFNIETASANDVDKFRYICQVVSRRSGHLMGVCVSGLVNRVGSDKITVGVDGTVFRRHPKYPDYMKESMDKFVQPGIEYELMLAEDGSGRGAALVAAVAVAHERK